MITPNPKDLSDLREAEIFGMLYEKCIKSSFAAIVPYIELPDPAPEVLRRMLAAQCKVSIEMGFSINAWNLYIAPLFTRTIAEYFIRISYILTDPEHLAKCHIYAGAVKMKKQLERTRKYAGSLDEETRATMENNLLRAEKHVNSELSRCEDWGITKEDLDAYNKVSILGMANEVDTRSNEELSEKGVAAFTYDIVFRDDCACLHGGYEHVGRWYPPVLVDAASEIPDSLMESSRMLLSAGIQSQTFASVGRALKVSPPPPEYQDPRLFCLNWEIFREDHRFFTPLSKNLTE